MFTLLWQQLYVQTPLFLFWFEEESINDWFHWKEVLTTVINDWKLLDYIDTSLNGVFCRHLFPIDILLHLQSKICLKNYDATCTLYNEEVIFFMGENHFSQRTSETVNM
jgi:hypothetical protein